MVNIEFLEKELSQKKLHSIYLFFGEEQYLIENCIKKIKNIFGECIKGINYILIDETNVGELISDIETPSFGYEKKLIIAKNTGLFKKEGKRKNADLANKKEKIIEYLSKNMKIVDDSCILIFFEEDADKKDKLYEIIEKDGVVCKSDFQKPIQLANRIKGICNAYKVQIDDYTIQYFFEVCGTDMQNLINEIRKLIEYAGEGGIIKKEDIDKLSIKKIESVIFDLTDNLGKKNVKKALEVLHNLIYEKEPVQKILITLYNHFKKIYLTTIAVKLKKDVIVSLDLKPNQTFLVNKYKTQAKYFNERELRSILQDLTDLDYKSKTGQIDLLVGLEIILCEYFS